MPGKDSLIISPRWMGTFLVFAIGLASYAFALHRERGTVLQDIEHMKQDIQELKPVRDQVKEMSTDIKWIKRALGYNGKEQ